MGKLKKQIAYVVYPGINLLDLVGIFSAMKGLTTVGYESFTVAESLHPLDSNTALGLVVDKPFHAAPHPAWLVVVGGGMATLKALGDDALCDYVLQASDSVERVIGVSSGALLLAGLGLLEGRKATTHRAYAGLLPRFGAIPVQQRWVEDGRMITCAGGTAAYELGLRLLGRYANEALARRHQLRYEYDPQPPFGDLGWDTVDQTGLSALLSAHQAELRATLHNRPELYQRLYGGESAVQAPSTGISEG